MYGLGLYVRIRARILAYVNVVYGNDAAHVKSDSVYIHTIIKRVKCTYISIAYLWKLILKKHLLIKKICYTSIKLISN